MEDSKIKEIGALFNIGDIVKYKNTGTFGVIISIEGISGELWCLLDSTNLYYNIQYLEKVTDIQKIKQIHLKNVEENIEDKINLFENVSSSYSAENIDAPGGAG